MQITSPKNTLAAVAVAAAFCAPAVAQARGDHGHAGEHGPQLAQHGQHGPKLTNVVVKGKVATVDGSVVTVAVTHANRHGWALKDQQVQLDVTNARIRVKDVNGDGARDAADVAVDDRVVAQVRVPRGQALDLTQAFTARRLDDVGPAPSKRPVG